MTAKLWLATAPAVADDEDNRSRDGELSKRFSEVGVYLIGVATVALISTSIRVWAGMDVIQAQISNLVKSDSSQDQTIEQLRSEINTLRVQVGVLRAITTPIHNGRP
jgi:hypothetical protein